MARKRRRRRLRSEASRRVLSSTAMTTLRVVGCGRKLPRTAARRALGNEQLTIREVMARVNFELGATDDGSRFVCEGDVRRVVMRMFDGGQLELAKEVFRNKPRFRYFRITRLDGPIAELERAYHDGEVA
jgi:hypothetical protein